MSFGLNRVELIGRLGADATVNHLSSGGRVANLSIATDESYINKQTVVPVPTNPPRSDVPSCHTCSLRQPLKGSSSPLRSVPAGTPSRWLRCARVKRRDITSGRTSPRHGPAGP